MSRVTSRKSKPPSWTPSHTPVEDPNEPFFLNPALKQTKHLLLQVFGSLAMECLKEVSFLKLLPRSPRGFVPRTRRWTPPSAQTGRLQDLKKLTYKALCNSPIDITRICPRPTHRPT